MSSHDRPLGHISIGVRDRDVSKVCYAAILAPLSLLFVYDSQAGVSVLEGTRSRRTLGFGLDADHEILNFSERGHEAHAPGAGCYIAFKAPMAIEEFHAAAMRYGGRSNGEPGLRVHYGA